MKLNPKLFEYDDGIFTLKSNIREALINIANAFCEFLQDNGITLKPADIQLLGSNAGFDYTDKSDIDLHIVADFEQLGCNDGILQAAFNAQRTLFNTSHDITVKGIPVELYVEDVKSGTQSNGVYSLMYDRWIKYPEPEEALSDEAVKQFDTLVEMWQDIINNAVKNEDLSEIQRVLNRLYMMRKNGLATQGRNSGGNYIFKKLRNEGYLQELKELRDELVSQTLTLESILKRVNEANNDGNTSLKTSTNTMKYVTIKQVTVDEGKLNSAKAYLSESISYYSQLYPELTIELKGLSYDTLSIQVNTDDEDVSSVYVSKVVNQIIDNSKYISTR